MKSPAGVGCNAHVPRDKLLRAWNASYCSRRDPSISLARLRAASSLPGRTGKRPLNTLMRTSKDRSGRLLRVGDDHACELLDLRDAHTWLALGDADAKVHHH